MDKMKKALEEFISTIEATGGVMTEPSKGYIVPVVDKEWVDLGKAYMMACEALGREPMTREDDEVDLDRS